MPVTSDGQPGRGHLASPTRDTYDKVAAKYADRFADELRHKPLDRALLGAFSEQARRAGAGEIMNAGAGEVMQSGVGEVMRAGATGEAGRASPASPAVSPAFVADIGCGPGHVTAYLVSLGLSAQGIDLSPGMIEVARSAYPGITFTVGEMPGLPFGAGELAGALLFYSIIHLTPRQRAATFAELAAMLRPGAPMLVAFQIGDDEKHHVDSWFGEAVSFDGYRLSVRTVTDEITAAGLAVDATISRAPYSETETMQRCYLLASKAVAG